MSWAHPTASLTPYQPRTYTPTVSITPSPTITATPTLTPTATATQTVTSTSTPVPTSTPAPTETATPAPPTEPAPETPPAEASISGVTGHTQALSLIRESRSAADWAAFFGVSIDELTYGETLIVAPFEHTVIVTGYGPNGVTVVDNAMRYTVSAERFLASWGMLGNMAVVSE